MITIVFLGDIVGRPGRLAIKELLPAIRAEHRPDLVLANGENAAGGLGIDPKTADEIFSLGVDAITLGNHTWQKKEVFSYLDKHEEKIIRPMNFPPGAPGRGWTVLPAREGRPAVALLNAIGRVFMPQMVDCPFRAVGALLENELRETKVRILDFHGEATSEKLAMAHYLNGKASLVLGTHTHVQTADERIFDKGTAYITDVGMCGPQDSVIGVRSELVVERFLSSLPGRFELAAGQPMLNGIIVKIDGETGRATEISRLNQLLT